MIIYHHTFQLSSDNVKYSCETNEAVAMESFERIYLRRDQEKLWLVRLLIPEGDGRPHDEKGQPSPQDAGKYAAGSLEFDGDITYNISLREICCAGAAVIGWGGAI